MHGVSRFRHSALPWRRLKYLNPFLYTKEPLLQKKIHHHLPNSETKTEGRKNPSRLAASHLSHFCRNRETISLLNSSFSSQTLTQAIILLEELNLFKLKWRNSTIPKINLPCMELWLSAIWDNWLVDDLWTRHGSEMWRGPQHQASSKVLPYL